MRPAIVVSGHTMALGVVRSLGAMGVPVILVCYDDKSFAFKSKFVSQCLRAPHPEQAEDAFVNFLVGCAVQFPGAVLFPASDESLAVVSRHKELLSTHFKVACTDWEVTRRFIDKQFTYSLAQSCGVPSPRTLVPRSMAEARSGAIEFGFPCLVKPCQSHLYYEEFHRKMVRAECLEQLEEAYGAASNAGLEVMLQELIPGKDTEVVNYNSYVWEGRILIEFTAVHVRNGPPWLGPPRVVVSRRVPEVIEPGRRIIQELGFSGFSCTEFKRDARDGLYKVLDVNGRHNLSTLLAVRCGINFPWQHYLHMSEGVMPQASEFQEEVYWIDLLRDMGYSAIYLAREGHTLKDYLRPYLQPHVFANFDRTDLGPFIQRLVSVVKSAMRRIIGRMGIRRNRNPTAASGHNPDPGP